MIKRKNTAIESGRHAGIVSYVSPEITEIIENVKKETEDPTLEQNIHFTPTALTHIRRIVENGGTVITDTTILQNEVEKLLAGCENVSVRCFITDPETMRLAEQRKVTRAEVAADAGLEIEGPKLMIVGSAPAAIGRVLMRRRREPMNDLCILTSAAGFASAVQLKEKLIESNIASVVVRGKKGGMPVAIALFESILRQIRSNTVV